ncbi:arylsulfatase [Microterricola gilva]|uniref:Arylsulfatase n=1 Tax=Microterricola gilva TaxID=393267 RepID=A0A4Q8ANX2_9MICO|nr:arylsulfatase [Microterricola gilva]RZU66258.1 arylsulfatase [Microterricola gilva]
MTVGHAGDRGGAPTFSRGYEGFGGTVGELASQSVPSWPAPRRARDGAPNVVVVLVDDMGFSDISPFGAEIDTPAIQELAEAGYRLTNYHSTPLCSPSRAALMTGLNPHRAGFGSVVHMDPGYPGYQMEIASDVPTLAESFRAGGYATFMVGKWHLSKEANMHDGADKSSWPVQRGFDRYFGSMDGFTTLFHPHRLISDNSPFDGRRDSEEDYLTDGLTDRAIGMLTGLRANDPDKPFFLYFAHHAVHGPVQAKAADIEKYRGMYDAGWDHVRAERFRRQIASGLFPDSVEMSASGPVETMGVPAWEDVPLHKKQLFARHMEVYAAAVDAVDQSVARLVEQLKSMGEYENTIIVFTSDNGATGEGGVNGTRSYFSQFVHLAGLPEDWAGDVPRKLELMGGPQVHGHYPRGWAHVSNTPFRYYKGHSYAGGVHVPLLISWPAGLARHDADHGVRDQYAYVTDIGPTILALAGIERLGTLGGAPVKELDGVSFDGFLRDRTAASLHRSQYVECGGQRGYFEDELKIVSPHLPGTPFTEDGWELYDVSVDPAETRNLAAERPDTVRELAAKWNQAAWRNTVFPMDDTGITYRMRPSTESPLSAPVTLHTGTPTLERFRSSKLTALRSFVITSSLEYRGGDEGVIVSHGDQGGGYLACIENGAITVCYNAYGNMTRASAVLPAEGLLALELRFAALPEMKWKITARLNGDALLDLDPMPQLLGMAPFTGISVGVDSGGPVDWQLHERRGEFAYSGRLHWVRYEPGEKAAYNPEIIADIADVSASLIE